MKKAIKYADVQRKKHEAATERANGEAQDAAAAPAIEITEDPALPQARLVSISETDPKIIGHLRKAHDGLSSQDQTARRVCVQGRVHRVAKQGGLIFVTFHRALSKMQCLLSGQLAKTYGAIMLARETSLEISGELWSVPAGVRVQLDRELHADYQILAHDSRFS